MIALKTELKIQHGKAVFIPSTLEGVTYITERKGSPSRLSFKVIKDDVLRITEGDSVSFSVDGKNIFYGYIFKLHWEKDKIINVIAYDQIRYLKNKDTYVYTDKTAGELLQMIAKDFNLTTGDIEDTGFKIASRIEENITLYDMIQNALDLTLQNKSKLYVLYDDFGKLTLKSMESMKLNLVIDEESGQNYKYNSSIDDRTYNQVKLTYNNKATGKRDVYITKDSNNIKQWGVLQYFDTLQEGENGKAKADALLKLYNAKTRHLSIVKAFGDTRVRAGSLIVVCLDLGDVKLSNMMLVEKCKHVFNQDEHTMDLDLRGGEYA